MGRRRGYAASKGAATAFKDYTMSQVVYAGVAALRQKMEAMYPAPPFTVDDLYRVFVAPDDIHVCKRAVQLGLAGHYYYWNKSFRRQLTDGGTLAFSLGGDKAAFPAQAGTEIFNDSTHLIPTLEAWAEQIAAVRTQFAQVTATLATLNKQCRTPREVRYFMPGLITIIAASGAQGSIQEELRADPSIGDPPSLPVWLLQECRKANETIASTQLLPDPAKTTDNDVSVGVSFGNVKINPFPGTWPID